MSISELIRRLRSAGVQPGDDEETRLRKQLLLFATGLMTAVPVFWLALYVLMGLQVSASLPVGYQLVSLASLAIYLVTLNFNFFRFAQLTLFLFFPFVLQWSLGNFITGSGVALWGLLAPVGAILLYGARDSIPWFIGYVAMTLISAFIDYNLADAAVRGPVIPPHASVAFFGLNFIAMGTIVYFLLRYSASEHAKAKANLEQAHTLLQAEQERSERLLLNINFPFKPKRELAGLQGDLVVLPADGLGGRLGFAGTAHAPF